MRWSLLSLVAVLAVLTVDVTALPTPQDGLSNLSLELLAITKPKAAGSVKASNFKKSRKTYRNAALKGKHPMFSVKAGDHVKSKMMPKGKDADHIFEAQTMGHAARKGGHSSTTLGPALKAVTDRINDPKHMLFLDPQTNRAKGRTHTAVQSGKTPAKDKNVVEYLEQTKAVGKATPADVDESSEADRIQPPGGWNAGGEPWNAAVPYGLTIL